MKLKDNLYVLTTSTPGNPATFSGGNVAGLHHRRRRDAGRHEAGRLGPGGLDKVKSVTDKPVTTIINTHTHGDHTGNNGFFGANVEIVAHENTKANMAKMDAFKGDNAQFLPKKTYTGQDDGRQRQGSDRPVLLRRGAHQRRHVRRVSGAAVAAHGRHVRVEGCAALRPEQRRQLRRVSADTAKVVAGIKNIDTVIPGHSPMMTPKDLQEFQRFTADLVAPTRGDDEGGQERRRGERVVQESTKYPGYKNERVKAAIQVIYDESK